MDPKEFKECIGRTVDLITHNIGRGNITLVWKSKDGDQSKIRRIVLITGNNNYGGIDDELQRRGAVTLRRDGGEHAAGKATGEARAEESG